MISSLHLSTSPLSLSLAHPSITLDGGQLLVLDPEVPPYQEDKDGDTSITYRWLGGSRVFNGQGHVTANGSGFIWSLRIAPEDGQAWALQSTTEGSAEVAGWADAGKVQLFHADNIRGVTQGAFLMDGRYFVSLSDWNQPLNIGRWQSFPGLWLHDAGTGTGLIYGVLSQSVWKHSLHGTVNDTHGVTLSGRMFSPGIPAKAFAAGETYVSEPIYLEIVKANTPSQAYAGYLDVLCSKLTPSKTTSFLTHRAYWDSWNDRQPYFWDVSMDLIQRTIGILKKDFPTVKSLEIDDGYAFGGLEEVPADIWTQLEHGVIPGETASVIQRARRLGAAFAYEDDYATARDRFPDGVDAGARAIKEAGLLAGIWLGLSMVRDARIVREHPEWLVSCTPRANDDPELANIFSGDTTNRLQVLDPSLPEVRDYLRKAFSVLFNEWKYEALKLDFWTYAFENDSFRLQRHTHTALELRQWLFSTIREYLPEESYLVACCDISTGNPFFSSWVDTIRYGIDIGNGKWESIRYSALTGTFLLHVEAWRFYLLNPDSIGALKNLPESEKRCFVSWCAVTRSLVEIAGDLTDAAERRPLQKMLLAPKNGEAVRIGEHAHLSRNEPAAIVFAPGDLFSRTSSSALPSGVLAVFNWSDETRTIEVSTRNLELPNDLAWLETDFYNENPPLRRVGTWSVTLPARAVRLSHLTHYQADQPAILDSHWAVTDISSDKTTLRLTLEGNSPEGFTLHWPFDTAPHLSSSTLPVDVKFTTDGIYQLAPSIPEDAATQEWSLEIRSQE